MRRKQAKSGAHQPEGRVRTDAVEPDVGEELLDGGLADKLQRLGFDSELEDGLLEEDVRLADEQVLRDQLILFEALAQQLGSHLLVLTLDSCAIFKRLRLN